MKYRLDIITLFSSLSQSQTPQKIEMKERRKHYEIQSTLVGLIYKIPSSNVSPMGSKAYNDPK